MDNEIELAPGMVIYRDYLIEQANAANHYPEKGRSYIVALWRAGVTESFPHPNVCRMVIDAILEPGTTVYRCTCGALVIGSANLFSYRMTKHRGRCHKDGGYLIVDGNAGNNGNNAQDSQRPI